MAYNQETKTVETMDFIETITINNTSKTITLAPVHVIYENGNEISRKFLDTKTMDNTYKVNADTLAPDENGIGIYDTLYAKFHDVVTLAENMVKNG